MRKPMPPTALALGLAVVLTTGCRADPFVSPEAGVTEVRAEEIHSASAAPPVLGDPAFTWDFDDPTVPWGPCPPWMPAGCELAVIQGDPEQPNADVLFKLKPGTTVPEHYHTSVERMVLLSGVLQVDYEGQAAVTMTPGIYAYGPAKLPHETHCLGQLGADPDCILFIAFEEPVDAIEGVPPQIPDEKAFIWAADDPAIPWGPCPGWMPVGCELAVIQGDPEQPNADALFKLAPNSRVRMHWHTSAERMVLLSGELRVNFQGQAPVIMEPFTYAYGPAKLPHDTRCGEQGECILFIAFEELVDAIDVRGGNPPHRH
jgi:quercetin dioxygenase-like cupin family protein